MFIELEKGSVIKKDDQNNHILFNLLSYDDILKDNNGNFYSVHSYFPKKIVNLETDEEKEYSQLFDNDEVYTVVKIRGGGKHKVKIFNKEEIDKVFAEVMIALPAITFDTLNIEDMKSLRSYLQQRYSKFMMKNYIQGQDIVEIDNLAHYLEHRSFEDEHEEKWTVSLESMLKNPEEGIEVKNNIVSFNDFVNYYSNTAIELVVEELELLLRDNGQEYYDNEFKLYFTDKDYCDVDKLNQEINMLS